MASNEMVIDRPKMPDGYGVPTETDGLLAWVDIETRLVGAPVYWLSTTRPDGRPHVVPRWGVWLDGAFWYDGSPATRHVRNIGENAACTLHLEDAPGPSSSRARRSPRPHQPPTSQPSSRRRSPSTTTRAMPRPPTPGRVRTAEGCVASLRPRRSPGPAFPPTSPASAGPDAIVAEHAGRRTDHVLDLVTAHDRPYVGAGNGPTLTGHQHPCERAVLPQRGSRALRPVPVSARARALLACMSCGHSTPCSWPQHSSTDGASTPAWCW